MAKQLKREYGGSWFHVMNRGLRGANIFSEKRDYSTFLDILAETSELWGVGVAAYCLVPDRYHLLVQTEMDRLPSCINYIKGRYTRLFNQVHHASGPLFQRRFRSVSVQEGSHLLDLMRFIHRIPLQEGLANETDLYTWSSHKGYVSEAGMWNWLHKDLLLSMLAQDKGQQRTIYRQFVL
jgi:REP element-mobilizing transposase RayT